MAHWFAIVGSPLVMLTALSAGYALVPWACAHQRHGVIDLVMVIALAVILVALGVEWGTMRRARGRRATTVADRDEFLSRIGIALSVLSALGIVAQWTTRLALGPCVS